MLKKVPNVDTIYILIDVEEFEKNTNLKYLEQEKENALLVATNNASEKHMITISNNTFQILPNGSHGYNYILRNNSYEVKIAQKRAKLEAFYPIQIRISSECLWSYGLLNSWGMIYNWIVEVFGNIIRHKVCRIDLCCHVSDMDFISNYNLCYKGKFKKREVFYSGDCINAITFGSRKNKKIYCRIYNKTLEIQETKKKEWFKDIWTRNNMNINNVWNIEFELKGDILREFNIVEINTINNHLKDLWHYCTNYYLVKVNRTNKRIERCKINNEWLDIQSAYDVFLSTGLIERKKQLDIDASNLIPSIVGFITSYSARRGEIDIRNAFDCIYNDSERFLKNKQTDFEKEVKNKMSLIGKRGLENGE